MDKEINFSDIQETASEFRASAEIRKPVEKTAVSIRIDNDIFEFFRKQGKGNQSNINAVLRSCKEQAYLLHESSN